MAHVIIAMTLRNSIPNGKGRCSANTTPRAITHSDAGLPAASADEDESWEILSNAVPDRNLQHSPQARPHRRYVDAGLCWLSVDEDIDEDKDRDDRHATPTTRQASANDSAAGWKSRAPKYADAGVCWVAVDQDSEDDISTGEIAWVSGKSDDSAGSSGSARSYVDVGVCWLLV